MVISINFVFELLYVIILLMSCMVCSRGSEADSLSGFGFELTFRLRREPGETAPPTWPAALLQALARYVFQSGERVICHSCTGSTL